MTLDPAKLDDRHIDELLNSNVEYENLDFKRELDIVSTKGIVGIAKDVAAMTNSGGGHIILGVDDNFRKVGLPAGHKIDEADLRNKINRYFEPRIDFLYKERDVRFFRNGKYPPLRGTLIRLPDDSLILYTNGFVPHLRTYPGLRVPEPLEILEVRGNDDPTKLAQEILALSKMNWNSARFCGKMPITVAFAQGVGKILSELPDDGIMQEHYKFYM